MKCCSFLCFEFKKKIKIYHRWTPVHGLSAAVNKKNPYFPSFLALINIPGLCWLSVFNGNRVPGWFSSTGTFQVQELLPGALGELQTGKWISRISTKRVWMPEMKRGKAQQHWHGKLSQNVVVTKAGIVPCAEIWVLCPAGEPGGAGENQGKSN